MCEVMKTTILAIVTSDKEENGYWIWFWRFERLGFAKGRCQSQIQISQPRSGVLEILEKEQFELKEIFTPLMKYN